MLSHETNRSIITAARTVADGFPSVRNPNTASNFTIDSHELYRRFETRCNIPSYQDLFGDVSINGRMLDEGEVYARRTREFDTQIRNDSRMAEMGIAMEDVEKFEGEKLKNLVDFLHKCLTTNFTSEQESISFSKELSVLIADACEGSLSEEGLPIRIPRVFKEQLLHAITAWVFIPVIERYQCNALTWMRSYIERQLTLHRIRAATMTSYPIRMQQSTAEAEAKVANSMKSKWLKLHSEYQRRRTEVDSGKIALVNFMNTALGICSKGAESLLNLVIYTCNVML